MKTRSALLVSLVLHAGILTFIKWSSPPNGDGGGTPRLSVALSSGDAGGLIAQENSGDSSPQEVLPPAATQSFTPPVSAISVPPTPAITQPLEAPPIVANTSLPSELPAPEIPTPVPEKKKRTATQRDAPSPGNRVAASKGAAPGTKTGGGLSLGNGDGGEGGGAGSGGGGNGYIPPRFLMRYKPPYPDKARAMRLEGTVLLLVSVNVSGRAVSVSVKQSSGSALLDDAAVRAVREWKFVPASMNGQIVAAVVEVPVRFRIPSGPA